MKYAVVTGGGRGLGKGFVDYLSGQGYFVFAGVRKIKPEYKNTDKVEYLNLDVLDDKIIEKFVNKIKSKTDTVNLLINNAAVSSNTIVKEHPEYLSRVKTVKRELLLKMFEINTISPLIIVQKFLSLLKSDPSFIINVSSCRASFHDEFANKNPNYGYAGSKIALNMFTFSLTKELPSNIKVFAVHPGNVSTDMNEEGDQTPYEQAEKIIAITRNWKDKFNGKFMRWSGEEYPL